MNKYHINPANGEVGKCRAAKNCPFGDLETDHYSSAIAAQTAYEYKMQLSHTLKGRRPVPAGTVSLSEALDLDLLKADIAGGYIDVRAHDEDDTLKVLCYSKITQFSGHWTEATKIARGLIVQGEDEDFADAVIVQRPWRKFFTLDQLSTGNWVLGDEEREGESVEAELAKIDFNARAEVTDKMDGSLGILYRHPDGGPALSTKGSFGSDQALYYTRLLRNTELGEQAADLMANNPDKTFLFEMVGRDNRIVLDYEQDGIVLLGVVRKPDGLYLSANDYEDRWSGGVTETMEANTVGEALALPDRPSREGVVIRILSDDPAKQMQLKVKQDDYKMLHRAVTGFSISDMRASIRDSDESMGELVRVAEAQDATQLRGVRAQLELLDAHPMLAGVKAEREIAYQEVILPRLKKMSEAKAYVEALPKSYFEQDNPAKAFAASIASEKTMNKSDLFNFFRARLQDRNLDELSGSNVLREISGSIKNGALREEW